MPAPSRAGDGADAGAGRAASPWGAGRSCQMSSKCANSGGRIPPWRTGCREVVAGKPRDLRTGVHGFTGHDAGRCSRLRGWPWDGVSPVGRHRAEMSPVTVWKLASLLQGRKSARREGGRPRGLRR